MTSSLFFSHLRTFCDELEHDSRKLRRNVSHPSTDVIGDTRFLDDLMVTLERHTSRLNKERSLFEGDTFCLGEIEREISNLYETNALMLTQLQTHIQKYDSKVGKPPSKASEVVSENHPPNIRNQSRLEDPEPPSNSGTPPKAAFFSPGRTLPATPDTPTLYPSHLKCFHLLNDTSHPKIQKIQTPPESPPPTTVNGTTFPERPTRSTDSTPDLSPGSLNTTVLMKASLNMTLEERFAFSSQCQPNEPLDNLDSLLDVSLEAFSPPKTSKLLQPRVGADSSEGWIPLISEKEWDQVPTFLKIQTNITAINLALEAINDYIKKTLGATCLGQRPQSMTAEELDSLIGRKCHEIPSKVLVMGLVQLKRLDISTENSIRVYTVRRYY